MGNYMMKLPKLILDALSHRCSYLSIGETQTQADRLNVNNDRSTLVDEFYWYMHPGHAEFVREWLNHVGVSQGLYESGDSEWDSSRPIQINVIETAKALRKAGI